MSRSRSVATMVGRRLAPKVAGAAPGLTETFVREALDRAIHGVGPLPGAAAAAEAQLREQDGDVDRAVHEVIENHVRYAGAQGFLTNIGGVVTAAVAIPANITGLALVQCRMIAGIAHLRGYDLEDPRVRNAVLACLLGGDRVDEMLRRGTLPAPPMALATAPVADPALDRRIATEVGADLIATIEGWSREDVDAFAAESNHRAAKAWANGYFTDSVIPVKDANGLTILDHDELIRPDTSVEGLAGLKPSFAQIGADAGFDDVALEKYHWVEKINHVHHAGNSSGIVDGAALMAIGTEEIGAELGLTPRARIVSMAVSGADPTIMLTGPAPAARKALAKAGLETKDIDLFEINEAFAAVAMRFMRDMGITDEITNVNGGAIAMGHPLGATGAMILGTLIDELQRRDQKRGLATLCVGGGMGIATIVEIV